MESISFSKNLGGHMSVYDNYFYHSLKGYSQSSARVLVPLLISKYKPTSVIDFGCGTGEFLLECQRNSIETFLGIEGDWLTEHTAKDWIRAADLSQPVSIKTKFDLALCLEVAEHLPQSAANTLIKSLTDTADVIAFSAAIPGQGGTNHINEQYPDYWAKLMFDFGFELDWDPRHLIWNDRNIAPWYRQNLLVYRKVELMSKEPIFPKTLKHPEIFLEHQNTMLRIILLMSKVKSKIKKFLE
jgi:hypothetical protein